MLFSNDLNDLAFVSPKTAAFVQEHDLAALENGRYDLSDGDFVNVMEYTSKLRADACYEAHEEYVDIQMVLCGAEYLEVAPTGDLAITKPFSEADDCALYDGAHQGDRFLMTPGCFCLVMPADAHMPGVAPADAPAPVKKAVAKIKVAHLGR